MGVPPHSGFSPVFIASEKGFFEKQKLDVELVISDNPADLYLEKKIDAICSGLTESILFFSEGHPTQIIYRFNYSLSNDLIVSSPKIKTIPELRGKKIAFNGVNTSSHIFVMQLLNKNGIREGEYSSSNLPFPKVWEELQKGNIQAGHIRGMDMTEIKKQGFNIIARSADVPDLLSDTLSVDSKFLKNHPSSIRKLVSAISEAREFYYKNNEESLSILSQRISKSETEISEELKSVRFLTLKENSQSLLNPDSETAQTFYPGGGGSGFAQGQTGSMMNFASMEKRGALFIAGESIIEFLRERGQLYRIPDLKNIFDDRFVQDRESK
ncbi:ABC transporter permease [Leptospira kobayashii]|uniref:ABC transporter permease n=1 Tax=Leptospira kobayashii TaxID=1917830 RepID=A0ABN6KKV9_9LEPT|nr:ABC transporter permease [Leptospira kobayashii]